MDHSRYPDSYIHNILLRSKTIAMVGASANTIRPSYFVLKYMLAKGFNVIPVNPGLAGQQLLGQLVVGSLFDITQPVDMVDIFRNSEAADGITDQAIEMKASIVWMQLGVANADAAGRAETAGLDVVMNRCPKIEYARLSGEIAWAGVNSGKLSSQKPKLAGKGFQHLTLRSQRNPINQDKKS